jgi:hypothetical protein
MASSLRSRLLSVALGAGLLGMVACTDQTPTQLTGTGPAFSETSTPTLIECPTPTARSISATVDESGGTLSVRGGKMVLPAGAVREPTLFTLTVPASLYAEISVTANGGEHFQFEKPVSLTISYSQCSRAKLEKGALSAWYVAPETKALLEYMGGEDDKVSRTVTFRTDHLSEYAIAN